MPARDRYHNVVIRALKKGGWAIEAEQIYLVLAERHLWIDLRASKESENRVILIEIKGFENTPSPIEYLAEVMGKYVLYQTVLDYLNIEIPLYLAVPVAAYKGILNETISQEVAQRVNARFMIFDPLLEEIVEWIH